MSRCAIIPICSTWLSRKPPLASVHSAASRETPTPYAQEKQAVVDAGSKRPVFAERYAMQQALAGIIVERAVDNGAIVPNRAAS